MIEAIDLVDSNGQIKKRSVTRDDAAHYGGLHMQIVIVVIRNRQGEFLVHKRALTKKVHPGDIDHVCGGIYSGETPEQTALREASEEGGVAITDLTIARQGINEYSRYCYLIEAYTDDKPNDELLDPTEVEWAGFYSLEELTAKRDTGEFTFVAGFFEDIAHIKVKAPHGVIH